MEYPFCEFGSAVPSVSPPKILPTIRLPVKGGGNVGKADSLDAVWALLSSMRNSGVLSTPFQLSMQSCCGEN